MPSKPTLPRRLGTAARWPLGVAYTSWRYMWRTTPMSRHELLGTPAADAPPDLPAGTERDELQGASDGFGPLFHRLYRVRIADPELSAEELMHRVSAKPNRAAPTAFSSFSKVSGEEGRMEVGDEYVVRMPGPWDGPVRVAETTPTSFRLVTLDGHLEAGQIRFRAEEGAEGGLSFAIESWARSGDALSNLLYRHARMAKEIQLHMWTSFLEKVVKLSGGRREGRLEVETRLLDTVAPAEGPPLRGPRADRLLAELAGRSLNYDPGGERLPADGWHYDEFRQPLPPEQPGAPVPGGSWEIARGLSASYAFADPAVVRAAWDAELPLERRDLLLQARVLGLRFYFGVRVGEVRDETREEDGRRLRVWGWNYRTLAGHVEMGQMDYEVRKDLDSGEVEFRVFACWRRARTRNPIVRLGFRVLGPARRRKFLRATRERMAELTLAELRAREGAKPGEELRALETGHPRAA